MRQSLLCRSVDRIKVHWFAEELYFPHVQWPARRELLNIFEVHFVRKIGGMRPIGPQVWSKLINMKRPRICVISFWHFRTNFGREKIVRLKNKFYLPRIPEV